jgi:hypothetical protein
MCSKLVLCADLEPVINYNLYRAHSYNAITHDCIMLLQMFCIYDMI